LFFGGYKKVIPVGTVQKVLHRRKPTDPEKDGDGSEEALSGPNYATRTDDEVERQYVQDGNTQGG
jgi:hypothetical protein